jgi:RNA polymerase sigma factor (sigma-70 family)
MSQPHPIEYVSIYLCMHRLALRFGLPGEDAEDCAMEFVTRSLEPSSVPAAEKTSFYARPGYLRRCAINYLLNFSRARLRRQNRERTGEAAAIRADRTESSLEARLLKRAFWQQVATVLALLAPVSCQIFLSSHLDGETIKELAASFDRTPHAVEQTLSRTRSRLRLLLERQGITESQLREYLACPDT